MFLFEPDRTQLDLNFRLFGVHVRVHPMFWLFSAIFGQESLHAGVEFLLIWIVCVFVSILVHEMGHVLMGRLFGMDGHIVLYSFGGLAIGSNQLSNRWKRMAVCFAGPLAQLLLFGVLLLLLLGLRQQGPLHELPPFAKAAINDLRFINLFWALMNLLPVWPLDGGQISRDLLSWLMPRRGVQIALGISFLLAGLLAINALLAETGRPLFVIPFLHLGGWWIAILFGMLAVGSFMEMQRQAEMRRHWDFPDEDRWDRRQDRW